MSVNDSLPIGFDEFTKLTNISHWIYRLWTIPFAVLGITGNIFALMIFIHWINRLSIYIYFSFLCIINILILSIDIEYHYLFPYIIDTEIIVKNILPRTCKCIFFLTYFFRYIFIWIITMINIDRCLYLTENSWKTVLCQKRSVKIICALLILFSFIANFHFLIYFNEPIITKIPSKTSCSSDGLLCHCKTTNTNYQFFWKKIWPIYNLMIFALIPFVIMIICCILILRNVRLTRQNVDDERRDSKTSITKTLICLDLLFPLTIFPTLFYQIYINYHPPESCVNIGIMNLLFSIGFAMIFIKNTFAFAIFYFSGQKFRQAFSRLIHCRKRSA
jgi:hypothetical protein